MNLLRSFEFKIAAGFTTAVLVVVGMALVVWNVARSADHAARQVADTQLILQSLANIRGDTVQIELSTQSYRISGDATRLAERDAAIASREKHLALVHHGVGSSPVQLATWTELRKAVDERLAISRRSVELRDTQGATAAAAYIATMPLQTTRNRVYQLVADMEKEELELLGHRNSENHQARKMVVIAGLMVALMLMSMLATIGVLLRRQWRDAELRRNILVDSEERLATTLHSIGDGVIVTDIHGRITRMNPMAETLTGWSWAQASGMGVDNVFCVVHKDTRQPFPAPIARVLETGQMHDPEGSDVLVARDGSERFISNTIAPIRDAQGTLGGAVLVFRDVTMMLEAQRTIREQNEMLERRVAERTGQLHESEAHLQSVINNVPTLIAYVDAQQRYVYVNRQYRELFAPGNADITGYTVRQVKGEERYAIASPLIAQALHGLTQSYDWQPFPGVWQVITYVPKRDHRDKVVGYYVLGSDITERKQTEERIKALNTEMALRVHELEQVSRALKTLSAGNRAMLRADSEQALLDSMCRAIVEEGAYAMAVVWCRDPNGSGRLQPKAHSGYPDDPDALLALSTHWAEEETGSGVLAKAIRSGLTVLEIHSLDRLTDHPQGLYPNGNMACMACPLSVDGAVLGVLAVYGGEQDTFGVGETSLLTDSADDLAFGIAMFRARARQHEIQQAMHTLTWFDALTGLPNETQFTEMLNTAIKKSRLTGEPFTVLQTSIEQLTEINDALGFRQGDGLLKEFGERLRSCVPQAALVARLRGDEFALLLPDSKAEDALALARRVQECLALPFSLAGLALDVSAKIGIALHPEHGDSPHDLLRHMDIALQHAKKKGMSQTVFETKLDQNRAGHLTLAGELKRAIEGGDLALYLQPKVDMKTGQVCGAEALVRWTHVKRGIIMPADFIGLAERTGLIGPLTEWMVDAALGWNSVWGARGYAMPIAVNLSVRDLRNVNLLEKVRLLKANYGPSAGLLEVEITESAVMEDGELALKVLHALCDEGIPLYIDDFGTGYSSLAYLQKLPVEYIKIDQSFVSDMTTSKDSALIVASTIDLAHDLGRRVVAEGVESLAQWHQLQKLGCDFAQGYFIARPMPADDFPGWLAQYEPPPLAALGFDGQI